MSTGRGLQPTALAGMPGLALSTPAGAEARDISRDTLSDPGDVRARPHAARHAPPSTSSRRDPHSPHRPKAHRTGTLFNGRPADLPAVHDAYNSGSERDLTADVGWTPTLHRQIDSARQADREVARGAGAGRIR